MPMEVFDRIKTYGNNAKHTFFPMIRLLIKLTRITLMFSVIVASMEDQWFCDCSGIATKLRTLGLYVSINVYLSYQQASITDSYMFHVFKYKCITINTQSRCIYYRLWKRGSLLPNSDNTINLLSVHLYIEYVKWNMYFNFMCWILYLFHAFELSKRALKFDQKRSMILLRVSMLQYKLLYYHIQCILNLNSHLHLFSLSCDKNMKMDVTLLTINGCICIICLVSCYAQIVISNAYFTQREDNRYIFRQNHYYIFLPYDSVTSATGIYMSMNFCIFYNLKLYERYNALYSKHHYLYDKNMKTNMILNSCLLIIKGILWLFCACILSCLVILIVNLTCRSICCLYHCYTSQSHVHTDCILWNICMLHLHYHYGFKIVFNYSINHKNSINCYRLMIYDLYTLNYIWFQALMECSTYLLLFVLLHGTRMSEWIVYKLYHETFTIGIFEHLIFHNSSTQNMLYACSLESHIEPYKETHMSINYFCNLSKMYIYTCIPLSYFKDWMHLVPINSIWLSSLNNEI